MPGYGYYTEVYGGSKIPETAFHCFMTRATQALQAMEGHYRIEGDQTARNLALCAMAEVLCDDGPVTAATVGSVSVRYGLPSSPLYQAARRYLQIYRGVSA